MIVGVYKGSGWLVDDVNRFEEDDCDGRQLTKGFRDFIFQIYNE